MSNKTSYIVQFNKWDDPLKRALRKKEAEDGSLDMSDGYNGAVMMTDMGAIPLNENTCLSSHFRFYQGHTNFPLEKYHRFLIDTTLGVEINSIKTPYMFLVAIAKLFDEKNTLKRLESRLISYMTDLEKQNNPIKPKRSLHDSLAKQFDFYAVVCLQGKNSIVSGKSQIEVENQVNSFIKDNPTANVEYSWHQEIRKK